jgi:succinate dehydrogenase / fumarate reductase cytochrome b subunit
MATDKRPLSPHLQVYRPQLTSVLSILHRATGVALSIGTLLIVYWLISMAAGPEAYKHAQSVFGSMLGQLFMFLWTWALFYHLCNGIRHLFWDAGYGFDMEMVYKSGKTVVTASVVLTFLIWIIVAP